MESNIIKPATVARVEFIENLTNLINSSNLPAFVIEPIFKDMLAQIQLASQRQYETDKKLYEASLTNTTTD